MCPVLIIEIKLIVLFSKNKIKMQISTRIIFEAFIQQFGTCLWILVIITTPCDADVNSLILKRILINL